MSGTWRKLLGGLLVWAAHFLSLYGIGEWVGDGPGARRAVLVVTALALGVAAFLAARALADHRDTHFDRWRRSMALTALGLSAVAILWQALPAVIGGT